MPTKLSRRDFLRLAAGSAAAISMSGFLAPFIKEAVAAGTAPAVIWLQGASCTGCSVSLLNTVHPTIQDVLLNVISLHYHPNISAGCGEIVMKEIENVSNNKNGFFLVVEGAVPTGIDGKFCTVGEKSKTEEWTFVDFVKTLGEKATGVINVGTCSAFGGIPAAGPNPTDCVPVSDIVDNKTMINIPGCPPHPDWIVGTLAHVILYGKPPELDTNGRPKMFYGGVIHDNCPRRQYFDNAIFAKNFSEPGCLLEIGCKGPIAHCDSTTRLWNGGVNWCVKSGAPCLACTEPEFPWPIYERLPNVPMGPRINATINEVGGVLAIGTALGIGGHLMGNIATGRIGGHEEEKKEGDV
ncbi:MAG: hydrogenase small subunit [Acidobacteriota bacterium]